ncbi:MAG: peptidase C25, partial [Flavobacteriaceae bacterium]|nr:peptidase C25 [Flavobacteriaceae bacterium]
LFYIGDPALKLHIPKREIAISHLNGVPVADVPVADRQFKALDKITLGGEILGPSGQLQQDFDGTVSLQIFDKEVERSTLGNDQNKTMNFTVLGEQVFEGIATVSNGQFSSTFVIPKDINLDVDAARISFIAFNQDKTASVGGFSNQFNIGGINADAVDDTLGPIVNVYLENRSFVDGGKVFDSPMLIVDFEDENGINSSGGLGHDITATLDDNQVDPYVLNPFYTTALDDFTKGTLTYPLNDLELGLHTLTLRAWDTHNNPSSKTISFTVVYSSKIQIENVFNSPNPVTNHTIFFIQHNKPRELLDVKISIFTIDGKRIWTNSQEVFSSSYLIDSVAWDATTYSGQKVNKGTYIYTIELISTLSNSSDIYSGKLIVK